MLHVRSYSVRLKRRNMETVSSFRRNQQRRKLGLSLSNASTASTSAATVNNESSTPKRTSSLNGDNNKLVTNSTASILNDVTNNHQHRLSAQSNHLSCPSTPLIERGHKSVPNTELISETRFDGKSVPSPLVSSVDLNGRQVKFAFNLQRNESKKQKYNLRKANICSKHFVVTLQLHEVLFQI
ncbi:hypothetical protein BLOT_007559 [Blomia tropicalis]|nr:hypothetical protein BLOT_007559 [Blomia tropicalis]